MFKVQIYFYQPGTHFHCLFLLQSEQLYKEMAPLIKKKEEKKRKSKHHRRARILSFPIETEGKDERKGNIGCLTAHPAEGF